MEVEKAIFILLLVSILIAGWLINNWIRARHGYAMEDATGVKGHRPGSHDLQRIAAENASLKNRLSILESRLQNVEAIVTEPGYDVSRQIEALRDAAPKEIPEK